MSKSIDIINSTIVEGVTSLGSFLAIDINDKNAGFPLFQFSYTTPDLDIVALNPSTNIIVNNGTMYDYATSYGAGVALTVNGSALAVPIFKITQDKNIIPEIGFYTATIVSDLTSTGEFMIVDVDNTLYGTPLYKFSSEFPFTTYAGSDNIDIKTVTKIGKKTVDTGIDTRGDYGSTNLNPKIEAYSDVIERIKSMMGYPTVSLEICDADIVTYIDQAIELYTKYTGYTEEYLIFNTSIYNNGCGLQLDKVFNYTPEMRNTCFFNESAAWDYDLKDYRKVIEVASFEEGQGTGINTLFTIEQIVANQVYFGNLLGSNGFDLVTFSVLKDWLDTREKVLAQKKYFRFDPRTQILRILPEPQVGENYNCVIKCYVERPIKHLISEPWIIFYTLALSKIATGRVRGKYSSTLFGGATLNFNEILNEGIKEKEELEKQLFTYTGLVENDAPLFLVG